MAFNLKTFQTRALTAIIFAAVMLVGVLWNWWSFFILLSVIHFGCWWEYFNLAEKIHKIIVARATRVLLMIAGFTLFTMIGLIGRSDNFFGIGDSNSIFTLLNCLVLLIVAFAYLLIKGKLTVNARLMLFAGFFYISLSWGLMLNLYFDYAVHVHDTKYVLGDFFFPLLIIISIWINDTMAYIVGSLIGKTPMTKISPKKTWEGTIGGIILSVAVIGLISYYVYDFERLTIHIVAIALIASVVGTLGDLLESKLKRMAGVKDSGSFMPGHGGFLDRFDSLLLAIPFVWLYMYLMGLV